MTRTKIRTLARSAAMTMMAAMTAMAVTMAACSAAPSRTVALGDLADDVIIPARIQLAENTARLSQVSQAFCATPDVEGLEALRSELAATRASWSYNEAVLVGPAQQRRSRAVVDWPIDPLGIDALLADTNIEIGVDRIARRVGADQRGLSTFEYLLGADDTAALAALRDERRCRYLQTVADVIATEVALLPTDWTDDFEEGGPYRATFVDPDEGGLDAIVAQTVFLLEEITDRELAAAMAEVDMGVDPTAIAEGPSGLAARDIESNLAGIRAVFVGSDDDLALGVLFDDDLRARLADTIDRAIASATAIDEPLRTVVSDQPSEVMDLRGNLKELQILISTEVVAELGVTIGFSDADGDTGG